MRESDIAVLSNQSSFREGVVQTLRAQGFQCVSEYCSAQELLATLADNPPRMVLIDLDHSADDPLPLLREFRHRAPQTAVVVIGTAWQDRVSPGQDLASPELPDTHAQALRAATSLALAAEQVPPSAQPSPEVQRQRELWSTMTPRQRDVLGFLSTGSDNLKIAAHLGISERAVKAHVSALLSLFSAENRTELAVLACRAGMRPPHRNQPTPLPRAAPRSA